MSVLRSLGFVSTGEVAERMGCTVQHVRWLIRQGKLSGQRVGRDWFVEEETLKNFTLDRYARSKSAPLIVREPVQAPSLFPDLEIQSVVNVATVPQRSPFRYPGGKTWLIPIARLWLSSLTSRHDLFVEPFAGGGGIGLTAAFEGFVSKSLLVELDPEIAVVWRVMVGGGGPNLATRIRKFDLTLENVHTALAETPQDEIHAAFLTILRNRVSRGGILAPGAGLVKNGEAGRGIASRWYAETLARRIEAIDLNKGSISFREADGLSVLNEQKNNVKAVFFIDPPYPVAGRRLYRFHDLDHRKLFEVMNQLQGPFLATYNNNAQISTLADEFGFESRLVPMKSTHHEKKFELLISRSLAWLPTTLSA